MALSAGEVPDLSPNWGKNDPFIQYERKVFELARNVAFTPASQWRIRVYLAAAMDTHPSS